jgi:hypothetical protein
LVYLNTPSDKICGNSQRQRDRDLWRAGYEKPMRTGQKQGKMQLNCFS